MAREWRSGQGGAPCRPKLVHERTGERRIPRRLAPAFRLYFYFHFGPIPGFEAAGGGEQVEKDGERQEVGAAAGADVFFHKQAVHALDRASPPGARHAAQGQSLMGGGAEKGQSFAAGPPKHVRVLHDGKQQEERIDHGIVQGEAGREPRPKPRKGVAEDRGKAIFGLATDAAQAFAGVKPLAFCPPNRRAGRFRRVEAAKGVESRAVCSARAQVPERYALDDGGGAGVLAAENLVRRD